MNRKLHAASGTGIRVRPGSRGVPDLASAASSRPARRDDCYGIGDLAFGSRRWSNSPRVFFRVRLYFAGQLRPAAQMKFRRCATHNVWLGASFGRAPGAAGLGWADPGSVGPDLPGSSRTSRARPVRRPAHGGGGRRLGRLLAAGPDHNQSLLVATATNFIWAAPPVLVFTLVLLASSHASPVGVAYAIVSGALASGCGYAIWYAALPGLTRTQAATVQLSVPVIAALGAVAVLAEPVTQRLFFPRSPR